MTKLNPLFVLAGVSVVLGAVFAQLTAAHSPAADPKAATEFILPREPYAGFYAYADKCLKKLTDKCGKGIYYSIFADDSVTDGCCKMLVAMGKRCHDGILLATLTLPELTKTDRFKIMSKSSSIWTECVSGPSSDSPSPSPTPSYSDS